MNKAKLEILGLEFSIGLFRVYHDDGFVKSLIKHTTKLDKRYNFPDKRYYEALVNKPLLGMHITRFDGYKHQHEHIYYLDKGFTPFNIFIRGHEEMHVVEDNCQLDLLSDKILEEQKVRINFGEVDDEEIRANLGGIYAMYARGMHPDLLNNCYYEGRFEAAKQLYEQSRLPERTIFT